jgi:hypothetical protein
MLPPSNDRWLQSDGDHLLLQRPIVGADKVETGVMNPESGKTQSGAADDRLARVAWETPETVEVDLGSAETANTNSNFDGTNFSS